MTLDRVYCQNCQKVDRETVNDEGKVVCGNCRTPYANAKLGMRVPMLRRKAVNHERED